MYNQTWILYSFIPFLGSVDIPLAGRHHVVLESLSRAGEISGWEADSKLQVEAPLPYIHTSLLENTVPEVGKLPKFRGLTVSNT